MFPSASFYSLEWYTQIISKKEWEEFLFNDVPSIREGTPNERALVAKDLGDGKVEISLEKLSLKKGDLVKEAEILWSSFAVLEVKEETVVVTPINGMGDFHTEIYRVQEMPISKTFKYGYSFKWEKLPWSGRVVEFPERSKEDIAYYESLSDDFLTGKKRIR